MSPAVETKANTHGSSARRLAWLAILAFAVPTGSGAMCARLILTVSGEVKNDPRQALGIRVESVPDANERQDPPQRDGASFKARLLFDPTAGYSRHRGHDCSRVPKTVRVLLLHDDRVVQAKELSFEDDFVEESSGEYCVRRPVVLEVEIDGLASTSGRAAGGP